MPLIILSTTALLNVCVTVDVFVLFYLVLVQSQTPFCEFRKKKSQCWCWLLTVDHVATCFPEIVFYFVRHISSEVFHRQTAVAVRNLTVKLRYSGSTLL